MERFGVVLSLFACVAIGCGAASANEDGFWLGRTDRVNAMREASNRNARNAHVESARPGECPSGMANVDGKFCVDMFEASTLEILPNGDERTHSPFEPVLKGMTVRAISSRGVYPQAYISGADAKLACEHSGKRLCRATEWKQACMGPHKKQWGYGDSREPRRCNDSGRSPVIAMFGPKHAYTWDHMNDSILNQLEGTLDKTGARKSCTNEYGVHDMVGNLHEWVDDPNGTFEGGYYQDVTLNGDGCSYTTTAHEFTYHDYSTGFRCCAEPTAAEL